MKPKKYSILLDVTHVKGAVGVDMQVEHRFGSPAPVVDQIVEALRFLANQLETEQADNLP